MYRTRKQSSTSYPIPVVMADSSGTPQTGKTVTCTLSKNGGAFASSAGAVSELSAGVYYLAGNATDRNTLGPLVCKFSASGCVDSFVEFEIVPYDVFILIDANVAEVNSDPNAAIGLGDIGSSYEENTGVMPGIRPALGMASADLDTQLDAILAAAGAGGSGGATIIAGDVNYIGPVAEDGKVTIYKGDASTLSWEITEYTGSVADGDAIAVRFLALDSYNDASSSTYNALLNKTSTASVAAGTLTLSFSLSASDTNTLTAGANNDGSTKYRCQVIATSSNITLVDTIATVRRRIGVA